MKISKAFPSKWLKADDLPKGKKVRCTIAHVEMENIGDEDKPVLYFQDKTKGMVLNKTNAGRLVIAYGDDTDDWTNNDVFLYVEPVSFQGKLVEAIRVDVPRVEATTEDAPIPF